jgi:hypothetical protein
MSVLPESPKLISGNDNYYPNLGSGTSGSGNSGTGNGYRVFCPGLVIINLHVLLLIGFERGTHNFFWRTKHTRMGKQQWAMEASNLSVFLRKQ